MNRKRRKEDAKTAVLRELVQLTLSPGEARDQASSRSWRTIAVTPIGRFTQFDLKGQCMFFTRFKRNPPLASAHRRGMWI